MVVRVRGRAGVRGRLRVRLRVRLRIRARVSCRGTLASRAPRFTSPVAHASLSLA